MAPLRSLSTAQVAKALGISVSTVKRWVDDQIVPARKTAGGHRKILLADLQKLMREGQLPQLNLNLLNEEEGSASPAPPAVVPDNLRTEVYQALRAGDQSMVSFLLHSAFLAGMPVEHLADQVICPVMMQIGKDWACGDIDVYQEHQATQLVLTALQDIKNRLEPPTDPHAPVALGGCPEGDHYILPSLLAGMTLQEIGWNVVHVGPNTPMRSFSLALQQHRPRLFWLSISYIADEGRFLHEYKQFYQDAERQGVLVAIGGRALTDCLRSQMPYTTFGDGLTHLAAVARSLHPRPRPPRRGRPLAS